MSTEVLAAIGFFAVRLVVPILVTLVFSSLLSRWDERRAAQDD